jgi:hypothetical protein
MESARRLHEPKERKTSSTARTVLVFAQGCITNDRNLLHPSKPDPGVSTQAEVPWVVGAKVHAAEIAEDQAETAKHLVSREGVRAVPEVFDLFCRPAAVIARCDLAHLEHLEADWAIGLLHSQQFALTPFQVDAARTRCG